MKKVLFNKFETNNTRVEVYKTNINITYKTYVNCVNEDLYIIVSVNKFTGEEYVRFGNYTQMRSIEKTYKGKSYFSLGDNNEN